MLVKIIVIGIPGFVTLVKPSLLPMEKVEDMNRMVIDSNVLGEGSSHCFVVNLCSPCFKVRNERDFLATRL